MVDLILLAVLIIAGIALITRIRSDLAERAERVDQARARFEQHRREFLSHGFRDED